MNVPRTTLPDALGRAAEAVAGLTLAALALLLAWGAIALWAAGLVAGIALHRWHAGYVLLVSSPCAYALGRIVHRASEGLFSRFRTRIEARQRELAAYEAWRQAGLTPEEPR